MKLPRGLRISTVLFAGVLVYFAVHAFVGQQGLLAWRVHAARADELTQELERLRARNAALTARIARLQPGRADPDLIEERAWTQLAMADPRAILIDLPPPARAVSDPASAASSQPANPLSQLDEARRAP
jgi:cell division protein FtsB